MVSWFFRVYRRLTKLSENALSSKLNKIGSKSHSDFLNNPGEGKDIARNGCGRLNWLFSFRFGQFAIRLPMDLMAPVIL